MPPKSPKVNRRLNFDEDVSPIPPRPLVVGLPGAVSDPPFRRPHAALPSDAADESKGHWRGKCFFLTYAQCDLPKRPAANQLLEIFADFKHNVCGLVVAQELHDDGKPHLHVVVALDGPVDIHGAHKLDLRGVNGEVFHGNYQTARSAAKVLRYVCKDGDVLALDDYPGQFGFEFRNALKQARRFFMPLDASEGWKGFKAQRDDFDAWETFRRQRTIKRPQWIYLPGLDRPLWTGDGRDCPVWADNITKDKFVILIVGPSNIGKSTFFTEQARDTKTTPYRISGSKDVKPWERGMYFSGSDTEQRDNVYIYDDVGFPDQSTVEVMSQPLFNGAGYTTHVPGASRYNANFVGDNDRWKSVFIVINNSFPQEWCSEGTIDLQPFWRSRTFVIDLRRDDIRRRCTDSSGYLERYWLKHEEYVKEQTAPKNIPIVELSSSDDEGEIIWRPPSPEI